MLELHQLAKEELRSALAHLEYSAEKVSHLMTNSNRMDDETLETWESFCVRFSRVADIFLMRYIRTAIKLDDPGFNGSFRDHLNQAEKLGLIDHAEDWLKVRELRNTVAHEYSLSELSTLFEEIKRFAPMLLNLKSLIS